MITPSIPHASNCTNPNVELQKLPQQLWESAVGQMWRRTYGCSDCGETAQIERFEAFEVEEEED